MGNNLMKVVQSIRSKDNQARRNSKLSSENQHSLPSPPIFKMNVHCFDELFEYLSLEDLNSLAQTCKFIQQMTFKFFTRNYSAANFTCLSDGIYMLHQATGQTSKYKSISVSSFIGLITWISIGSNIIAEWKLKNDFHFIAVFYKDLATKLKYIKSHADELKSVKKITLINMCLDKQTVDCIKKLLPNIEVLELQFCKISGDFNVCLYETFLKYCKNLRKIQLIKVKLGNSKWLLQHYEKLEHLELVMDIPFGNRCVDYSGIDLSTFFERNPNVRRFSCNLRTLTLNEKALLNSKANLDSFELILIIRFDHDYKYADGDDFEFAPVWDFLHQLHAHSFYKRLHMNTGYTFGFDRLPAASFLERLLIWSACRNLETLTSHFIGCTDIYLESLQNLVENFSNVKRLYLDCGVANDILLLMQRLKNLERIKLDCVKSDGILELDMLNAERETLMGAHKVTIYVPDAVYLATKWATKNGTTNFSLIEMKRIDSIEWNGPTIGEYMTTSHIPREKKNSQILKLFRKSN